MFLLCSVKFAMFMQAISMAVHCAVHISELGGKVNYKGLKWMVEVEEGIDKVVEPE